MDRRQYLLGTGTVLLTGLAGCLGGGNKDTTPDEPYIVGTEVQTSPRVRINVQIRNPTENTVERKVWIRVVSKDGNTLATRSKGVTLNPTPGSTPASIPFFFTNIAWNPTEVATDKVEAVLTEPGASAPF